MRVCLMVEGQEGVTWDEWIGLGLACEDAGLEGMFRSDHYLSVQGRVERGSLDAWTTLAGLAAVTERIRLGTLVSPVTFRHPSVVAKSAVTVDHISRGRVELGLGAGWLDAEHRAYGFRFPEMGARILMLAEQLELVHRQWTEGPVDFRGVHYEVIGLDALPKPVQVPHLPLIVGGLAGPRSLHLAARWADEYNTVFASPDECRRRREALVAACEQAGREPLPFSLMTGCVVGDDSADLRRRARSIMERSGETGSEDAWLASLRHEWVVGTLDEASEHLARLEDAGVERVMLQHQIHEDLDMVHLLGALQR